MHELTPLFLSRVQFGFVISFHIIFPAFSIGLASWLAFLAGMYVKTNRLLWRELYLFWLKIFAVGFAGLVVGIWPNLLPPSLSIWDAAAPPSSQGFVLVGTLIMLPAVLGYTWWSYSIFKGKMNEENGYH